MYFYLHEYYLNKYYCQNVFANSSQLQPIDIYSKILCIIDYCVHKIQSIKNIITINLCVLLVGSFIQKLGKTAVKYYSNLSIQ